MTDAYVALAHKLADKAGEITRAAFRLVACLVGVH